MGDNQYTISIGTDADTSNVEDLAAKLHDLEDTANRVSDALGSTDGSSLQEVGDDAEDAANNLENADNAANDLANDVDNVNGGGLEDVANDADDASGGMDDASDSANAMSAAATGLAGLGIADTMLGWADSSGNVSAQWARMAIAMKSTGMTAAQVQSTYGKAVSELSSSTGRGAGDIRDFFIQMGLSGVTSIDTIKSSFSALAGSAFVTGNNLEGLEEFFERLTKSGKLQARQLATQFKMNMSDIGNAMKQLGINTDGTESDIKDKFQKMSESQRAQVLSTALTIKDGKNANDDYIASWDGVKQQVDKAGSGLMIFAGSILLPTLIPALQLATTVINDITGAFKSAPGPVQQVLGVVGTLAAGLIVLVLGVSTLRSAWGLLNIGDTINDFKKLGSAIANPTKSIGTLTQKVSDFGSTTKKSITSAGSTISSFASNAGSKIKDVGTAFINSGKSALTAGANYVKSGALAVASALKTGILTLATWAQTAAQAALNFVMSLNPITIIIIAIVALVAILLYLWTTNEGFRNALIGAWTTITGFFSTLPGAIGGFLLQIISRIVSFGASIYNGIHSAFNNAVNTAKSIISQLPGIVWNEMINIGNKIAGAAGYIFQQVQNVFGNIVQWAMKALGIASPGYIARAIGGEMGYVVDNILSAQREANSAAAGLGNSILSGFGSPTLSVGTSIGYGSASLGFDASEINKMINKNEKSQSQIVNYNTTVNQEGIMSLDEAATFIVQAVKDQLWKENIISGKIE